MRSASNLPDSSDVINWLFLVAGKKQCKEKLVQKPWLQPGFHPTRRLILRRERASLTLSAMKSVAVIGAGITGLTAAFYLKRNGVPVTVYEASGRVGGVIQSLRKDGFLAEFGPNTLLETSPKIGQIVRDAAAIGASVSPDAAAATAIKPARRRAGALTNGPSRTPPRRATRPAGRRARHRLRSGRRAGSR